jgi:hypothetical protein
MLYYGKWDNVKLAVEEFLASPAAAGIGVGAQFFPLRFACDVVAYATPAVPITLLPGAAPLVTAALEGKRPYGGTPTVEVLSGVMRYMKAWGNAHPDRKGVVILATDGVPDNSCGAAGSGAPPNSLANAVAVASEASHATPPIGTFVIGVGSDLQPLEQLAAAGGAGAPIFVDTSANVAGQFAAALASIRTQAVPCDYTIPDIGAIDPSLVNVTFTPSPSAAEQALVFVPDVSKCGEVSNGYTFDDDKAPKKISLCPNMCSTVKNQSNGRVDIVYGCQQMTAQLR